MVQNTGYPRATVLQHSTLSNNYIVNSPTQILNLPTKCLEQKASNSYKIPSNYTYKILTEHQRIQCIN